MKYLVIVVVLALFMVEPAVYSNRHIRDTEGEPFQAGFQTGTPKRSAESSPKGGCEVYEDFQKGILSDNLWKRTRKNDFRQSIVDVFEVNKGDFRLRLRADTMGTRDDTVKYHGVRSLGPFDCAKGKIISFELDWNNQANGSYLAAGLYLCPAATDTNPRDEPDWIAFEYVGVPPGKNARFQVTKKERGSFQFLFTEGWPQEQRIGRRIGNQRVELIIDGAGLAVRENERELFRIADHGLDLSRAYLYFQMSSHSNYGAREVYFDNIEVKPIQPCL